MTSEKRGPEGVESATLGGGCFWCLEAVFQRVRGVTSVTSGYAGGHVEDPTYREVCSGSTGHAEVVRLRYDPDEVTYRDLLEIFFTIHDPTTRNRQGADVGPQYRSIILWHDEDQREAVRRLIGELETDDVFGDPIVTEVEPLEAFFAAEEHHQDYFRRNPGQPYCQAVVAPKVARLRERHREKLAAPETG